MSQFHEQPFEKRWGSMDDEAMAVFAAVWKTNWSRYGLNRAEHGLAGWPDKWKFGPDVGVNGGLIEVQGFGADMLLKIKDRKRAALNLWAKEGPVRFFGWHRTTKRWFVVSWNVIDIALDTPFSMGTYHDGPSWAALHVDQLTEIPVKWNHYDPEEEAA